MTGRSARLGGQDIGIWRDRMGWSQARLAKELGVSRATVISWEQGELMPRMVELSLVALETMPSTRRWFADGPAYSIETSVSK